MNKQLNIAIVSTNKNKYSETFIHNHINYLPGNIHLLFNGYLPTKFSLDKGLTETEFINENVSGSPINSDNTTSTKENLQKEISAYLIENRIQAILCEYGPSGVEMIPVALRTGVPMVVHFHGYDAYRMDVLSTYGVGYPELFKVAKIIVVVSGHMAKQLKTLGCPAGKIKVLRYGVKLNLFTPDYHSKKEYDFIACGRFVEKKSPQSTIRAFSTLIKKFPSSRLIMIGDGELLNDCIKLSGELGLSDNIVFKGALCQEEVAFFMQRSRIYLQHSVTTATNDSEGTPLAILEAGACGLPVISTRHAGIPDVVRDGVNGYLVEQNNIEEMSKRMEHLLGNESQILQMGRNARQNVEMNFKLETYLQELYLVMEQAAIIVG